MRQRKLNRLAGYDYSSQGCYFVTVCTQNRENLFGEIINGRMILNDYGRIIEFTWFDLKNHISNLLLDCFVVMPNHIHGIVMITNCTNTVGAGSKPAPNNNMRDGLEPSPTTLSEIIRQFKTFSAKRINLLRKTPGMQLWQRGFYDHIIRNEKSLHRIREYVLCNPLRWDVDKENIKENRK